LITRISPASLRTPRLTIAPNARALSRRAGELRNGDAPRVDRATYSRALVSAADRERGTAPTDAASPAAWKAVLHEWYDGHMDHWHSWRAVLEAIRHVPVDGPIYSTSGLDLKAYAHGVC
jgi:hypothetical protein